MKAICGPNDSRVGRKFERRRRKAAPARESSKVAPLFQRRKNNPAKPLVTDSLFSAISAKRQTHCLRPRRYRHGMTETIFGSLIFLGYWSLRLGILGALGSIVTFIGATSIIPFLPDGWAHEAGGFPIMTLPLTRAALEIRRS